MVSRNVQSDFKVATSKEASLLKVLNGLLSAADSGNSFILILLDLTAAFDTIDHSILIECLKIKWTHSPRHLT